MATNYTIQSPTHAGLALTYVSPPANGDVVPCANTYGLIVVNPSANGTVTVALPAAGVLADGLAVTARTISCASPSTTIIPLPPLVYGNSATLTWTGTLTTVQAAVVQITT